MPLGDFVLGVGTAYQEFTNILPPMIQGFLGLFILVLLIMVYAVFVWKFYRFIGTKNIFHFDLNRYNKSDHPFFAKLIAGVFYLLEYILIIPFIIFFWYLIFTAFLIFLIEDSVLMNLERILLISAVVIASIRMASYIPDYGESLSRELAKMFPFLFLAVSILNPAVFSNFLNRVSERISEIPQAFPMMLSFLLFIIFLEVLLRFFAFVFDILGVGEDDEESEIDEG